MTSHPLRNPAEPSRARRAPAPARLVRRFAAPMLALLVLTPAAHAAAGAARVLGATPETARHALATATLHTLDGHDDSLARLRGHVVVVNFWASWCAPCRREMPRLAALDAELAAHGDHVIAVSIDDDPANARRFLATHALALPVAVDGPNGLARALDLQQVPVTLVLDRDGSIACAVGGGDEASLARVSETARRLAARAPVASVGSETP